MDTVTPHSSRLWAYLQLVRPANVVTAWADVLTGFAVAGVVLTLDGWTAVADLATLGWLLLATTGLYGGGVVLNDVFDAELDAKERPERPIPSGRSSRQGAALFGGVLLVGGIIAAGQVQFLSVVLAVLIAAGAVLYDARAKHHTILGPLNMGLCRGGNLLLGMSAVPAVVASNWYLALLPVVYIAAITAISQGEVHGGEKSTGYVALGLVTGVIGSLLLLGLRASYHALHALPFVVFFAAQVIPPFVRATRNPAPRLIRRAVKAGVLALIPLNAALAAGFAGWIYGLGLLGFMLISLGLGRSFAVT